MNSSTGSESVVPEGTGASPGEEADPGVDLVVITGHSGAGKSEAIAAFEDSGYVSVDNLPPQMIEALGELFALPGSSVERAAVVTDVRSGEYFDQLVETLE
ncbi:MAG: RNase adapter RapZ, partial [Solirubrobacterales bacterium]